MTKSVATLGDRIAGESHPPDQEFHLETSQIAHSPKVLPKDADTLVGVTEIGCLRLHLARFCLNLGALSSFYFLKKLAGTLCWLVLYSSSLAYAVTSPSFTLDGQLSKVDGSGPWLDPSLKIKLQVLNPSEDCILYEESQTIDTQATNGFFNIQVGTAVGNPMRTADDPGNPMVQVYGNSAAINGKALSNGSICTYNPAPGAPRFLRISLQGSDGSQHNLNPNLAINSVPSAVVAETSQTATTLQGKTPNQFLNLETNPTLNQINVESLFTATNYSRLMGLLSVPPANYVQSPGNGAIGLTPISGNPPTGLSEGQFWYDSGAKALKFYDGSGPKTLGVSGAGITSITAGDGLSGGTITDTGTIGLGTELAGLNALSTTGFVKRTAAGTYSTPGISLTADVSGVLPLGNGGSNANLTANNGGIVYSNATQMQILSGTATAGLPLISGANTTPAWSTVSLAGGNVALPASGNISNASGAMTVSASTNLTLQANTGSTTTLGNPNTTSATVINGGGVGGGITLVPGSLGLAINGWSSSGFVKNNVSGVLSGGNSIVSSDVSDATSSNTANKLVLRDGSGNFAAGTITGSGMVTGTLQVTGGSPSSGKVLTSDNSGNATWQSAAGGFAGAVNINSTPYSITTSDSGKAFYYTNNATGVVNLPALSGVSDGFSVTINRQVAKNLTITPNGSDKFPGGLSAIEMQGQNIQSMTVMKLGSLWTVVNKTDECVVGQDCWTANATGGMKQLYAGTLNGRQYFTTPGGCTDSTTPTCAGGTDSITKVWSSSATTSGAIAGNTATVLGTNSAVSGLDVCSTCGTKGQSQYLAEQFTDTAAAKFCENMDYAGYTDWYLPAKEELALLYRNGVTIGGFVYSSYYWSSTENTLSNAWGFYFNNGYLNFLNKTNA